MKVDLESCLRGDKTAWDDFVRETAGVIYAAVRRSMRSPHNQCDLEDRVQDVYVRLLREDAKLLRVYDARRASLSTWLTLVARTVVHEHYQKRTLLTAGLLSDEIAAPAPPEGAPSSPAQFPRQAGRHVAAELEELSESPIARLNGLSPRQREVLQLLFEQSLTVEEAAQRLGVDAQTIRSMKHKALSRLREQWPNKADFTRKQG